MNMQERDLPGGAAVLPAKRGVLNRERLTLVHPTRAYAVSGNPFAIASILPLTVLCFLGVEIALLLNADPLATAGGLAVAVMGLLLIPALTQRGSLTLTHDGISFAQGKRQITSDWEHVAGIVSKPECGLCLEIVHPEMNVDKFRAPGGLGGDRAGVAHIPLRFFGDRQYSILYDIRERLPEQRWKDVLTKANNRSATNILVVYGMTVAVCALALFTVMWNYTH